MKTTGVNVELYAHQKQVLEQTKNFNKVGYYLDMGLGKTFVGSEKAVTLGKTILLICPKSLVTTWVGHFKNIYNLIVVDLTSKRKQPVTGDVYIITYDLIWRRTISLTDYTLILDESSYIQNETSKRTKAILKLQPTNVILLSGTPTAGRYERLYSQCKLLGWNITKKEYWNNYVDFVMLDMKLGFKIPKVVGYKNIDALKEKLKEHGCIFMKTEDVLTLPEQTEINIECSSYKALETFKKHSIVEIQDKTLVGDMALNKLLYTRQLCGMYNKDKLDKLKELIESTDDRLIIFYNFKEECELIKKLTNKPVSEVNGSTKDLTNYNNCSDSITLIQYQSGSMGLNLQLANKIIYFTPTLSAEQYLQSKKRTHRLGQKRACFYYHLICDIEFDIYDTLDNREDYTLKLFETR